MKKYGLTHARIPSNLYSRHVFFDLFYKKIVIQKYRRNFKTTNFFSNVNDFIHIKNFKKYKNKSIEIMTHPIFENGILSNRKDIDFENLCLAIGTKNENI